ncbi:hypothetical protein BJX96DRAFT_149754, partial [Aspergillus floccosus]
MCTLSKGTVTVRLGLIPFPVRPALPMTVGCVSFNIWGIRGACRQTYQRGPNFRLLAVATIYGVEALLRVVSHRSRHTPPVRSSSSDTINKTRRQDNSSNPRCFSRILRLVSTL